MQHQASVRGNGTGAGTYLYFAFGTASTALAPVTRADEHKLKQVHLRVVRRVRRVETVYQEVKGESGLYALTEQKLKWM